MRVSLLTPLATYHELCFCPARLFLMGVFLFLSNLYPTLVYLAFFSISGDRPLFVCFAMLRTCFFFWSWYKWLAYTTCMSLRRRRGGIPLGKLGRKGVVLYVLGGDCWVFGEEDSLCVMRPHHRGSLFTRTLFFWLCLLDGCWMDELE